MVFKPESSFLCASLIKFSSKKIWFGITTSPISSLSRINHVSHSTSGNLDFPCFKNKYIYIHLVEEKMNTFQYMADFQIFKFKEIKALLRFRHICIEINIVSN